MTTPRFDTLNGTFHKRVVDIAFCVANIFTNLVQIYRNPKNLKALCLDDGLKVSGAAPFLQAELEDGTP